MAAREATKTIPIVMIAGIDPVESGLVASLARPGANVTGFTRQLPGLAGKRLQLLREAVPRVSRVSVIWNPGNPATATDWKETQAAARTLGIKLESVGVRGAEDFLAALPGMLQRRPAAVVMIDDTVTVVYREILAEFALKNRIPTITAWREFTEVGGLMSYGPRTSDLFRRAAGQVDKILKGAKPAELPVEQPTKVEFVINLRTAKALGLTIPPSLLLRADQVIE
jgi:putative ABC transport system substrate-binding protein